MFGECYLGSKISPTILGNGVVVRVILSIFKLSDLEYLAGLGVNKVHFTFSSIYYEVVNGCSGCYCVSLQL